MQGLNLNELQKLQDTLKATAIQPSKQAQIPLTSIPKQRGGAGRGQGRKPANGEKKQSKVIRVPLDKLDAVNAAIAGSSPQGMTIPHDCLNLVTQIIKIANSGDAAYTMGIPTGMPKKYKEIVIHIIERLLECLMPIAAPNPEPTNNQPAPTPTANIKEHHRAKMRYAMQIDGIDHYWSGRGRMPQIFSDYVYSHGGNYKNREEILSKFLIK